jgi:flavodoxin
MKTAIIYESVHHGNTKKIAQVMANVLEAQLLKPCEVDSTIFEENDIIGFGSGIYFGKHHKSLFELIDSLSLFNNRAFIFSTRGGTPKWLNHRKLKKKLMKKGCRLIGEFSCSGYDTFGLLKYIGGIQKGRPDEKDLRNARNFAININHTY